MGELSELQDSLSASPVTVTQLCLPELWTVKARVNNGETLLIAGRGMALVAVDVVGLFRWEDCQG